MHTQLATDFERFGTSLPRTWPEHVREVYRIDLAAEYLGHSLPHPIGKASGQLSLKAEQLETDAAAGLACVILKTVIGEDPSGHRTMGAWAIHETKMKVERRSFEAREGWSVSWKGRGWDRTLDDYLELVSFGRDLARAGGPLSIPSVKLHLPRLDEAFSGAEYAHTISALSRAWGEGPLLVEKDFSPTLAGDALADEQERILRWIDEVPPRIRADAPGGARVALKLMNARFDEDFQLRMLERAAQSADAVTAFNRLWDPEHGMAYGGWELSDRNLRVLRSARRAVPISGTGNICSGALIADYARAGCSSVQLHTQFQLPLTAYPAAAGSRTARTLHRLVFDPHDGLVASLLKAEERGEIARRGGELRFRDLVRRS
jgi:hypothetical protein